MNARLKEYMTTDTDGFSSLLARATGAVNPNASSGIDDLQDEFTSERLRNTATGSNRNLSSILSRIQDDGPALALSDDKVHLSGDKKSGAAQNKKLTPRLTGVSSSVIGKACTRGIDVHNTVPAVGVDDNAHQQATVQGRKSVWPHLLALLALVFAGAMYYSANRLIDRTDNIIQSLKQQDESKRVTAHSQQPNDILPLVASLNEELKALKNEFQAIRNDYRDTEHRLSMKIPNDLADRLTKLSAAEVSDSALQNNLQHIRHDMAEMKQVIKAVGTVAPAPIRPMQADTGDWVVNLASLSSRDKAQQAVTRLRDSGVAPTIQEAVVNGERIYRLSVAGFISRDEATVFINRARKELGFEGGWIRRS
jgi:cell division septation protein DedD